MVSTLINMIQHVQYYLIILLIDLKAATLLEETLAQTFSCEFCKISRNNVFIEHICATAFRLTFANPRKKSMKELV